jgi:dolichyl-diphosphooligosaccharide--protein glycosyltransferase
MGNKRKASGAAQGSEVRKSEAHKLLPQVNKAPEDTGKTSGHVHKPSADTDRSPADTNKSRETRKSYLNVLLHDRTLLLLGAVMILALIIRLLPIAFSIVDGHVVFQEFDPYYHMRRIMYSVEHFPGVNAFDSYVNYPAGYVVGWPPLFDLLGASLSLIVGLGHPGALTTELTSAMLPVILGVLSIVPLYFIVKDAMGKHAALIAALVMAILPASVFRTVFGYVDHHALEVFLLLATYLLFTRAVTSAKAGGLSLSGIKAHGTTLIYAVLAGIGVASMVFAFDVSPLFIGILVAYAFVQFALDSLKGERSQYLAIVGAVTSIVALLIVLPPIAVSPAGQQLLISMVYLSWFQVIYLAVMLAFFVLMGALSDALAVRKAPWYLASVIFIAIAAIAAAITEVVSPQILVEIGQGLGFLAGSAGMAANINEMRSLFAPVNGVWYATAWAYFSVAGVLAILGLAAFLLTHMNVRKLKHIEVFFFVWTAIVAVVGLMQTRWVYLLAVTVSIFAGYALYAALSFAGMDKLLSPEEAAGRKKASKSRTAAITPPLVGVSIIALIIMIPVVDSTFTIATNQDTTVFSWNDACDWVKDNTPATSYTYAADAGTHPEYGVMTWWDYGNYVLYRAERPAVANNFQTGVSSSAHFFIAQNETAADAIMDSVSARYVMLDGRMGSAYANGGSGIFENMPQLAGDDLSSYHMTYYTIEPTGIFASSDGSAKYYDTIYSRMYYQDGMGGKNKLGNVTNGLERYRLVYDNTGGDPVKVFEYVNGARITGKAGAGARVELALNVSAPDGERTYYSSTTADQHGAYIFTVPYPTSESSGPVKTADAYTVSSGASSVRVQVSSDAVNNGTTITAGDL